MRLTVVWHEDALQQLTRIWLSSSNKSDIAVAADAIDRFLSTGNVPEIHDQDGEFELEIPPLKIMLAVSRNDRLIQISEVHVL